MLWNICLYFLILSHAYGFPRYQWDIYIMINDNNSIREWLYVRLYEVLFSDNNSFKHTFSQFKDNRPKVKWLLIMVELITHKIK